jgi:hypothetical protein
MSTPQPHSENNAEQFASTPTTTSSTKRQSLWTKAVSMLDSPEREALKDFITAETQDLTSALESIRNETERIIKANTDKAWKIKFMGEDVVLRDVGMKVLQWVDKFKQIGDIAIQYDPVHAVLPWAAFRFLLQVKPLPPSDRMAD